MVEISVLAWERGEKMAPFLHRLPAVNMTPPRRGQSVKTVHVTGLEPDDAAEDRGEGEEDVRPVDVLGEENLVRRARAVRPRDVELAIHPPADGDGYGDSECWKARQSAILPRRAIAKTPINLKKHHH